MNDAQANAADALRKLALDEGAKEYVLAHPELYALLHRAASAYIGGETPDACREVGQEVNSAGQAVTIDYMGESTRGREAASDATAEFVRVANTITEHKLNASVSLDLSHVGLVLDEAFCIDNMSAIAEAALKAGTEVMISAEGTGRTDAVLRVHERLCEKYTNIGITIQAFLYRSSEDIQALLTLPGKVRVVKGAFDVPSDLAVPRGAKLNAKYVELVRSLVCANRACSIATHDPEILDAVIPEINGADVEFEMLRGVCSEQLSMLKDRGYSTRSYLPYGREWFLYLFNRLAEYPPSIFDAIVSMMASENFDNPSRV